MSSKNTSGKVNYQLFVKWFVLSILAFIALLFVFVMGVKFGIFGHLPTYKELKEIRNYTASEVYSSDNYLLGRYYLQNRTNTNLNEIPEFLINALVATEDARFYSHKGIDTRGTFRVLIKSMLFFNHSSGGGSTLSQQLAKNLYPRRNLSILTLPVAKVKEIILAHRLEQIYSKKDILRLYLNTVPFGENTYGVETAALIYFNKKTSELLPEESAMLVGILKGTQLYNPSKNRDAALKRRNTVIRQMEKYGYIKKKQADILVKRPLSLNTRKLTHDEGPAPYFREFLRSELKKWSDENTKPDGSKYNIYTDGLKIYTTINYQMQVYAEKAVEEHMKMLQKEFNKHWIGKEPWKKDPMVAKQEIYNSNRYKQLIAEYGSKEEAFKYMRKKVATKIFDWDREKECSLSPLDSILYHFAMLQTGMITMEAKSGYVKAWVGGINYKYFKYDHVTSYRQAGSTVKPLIYALALENGVKPCDFYPNDSVVYTDYNDWVPRNSNRSYGGYYSVKGALANSINTISVRILMDQGIDKTIDFMKKLGMEGDIPAVPSMALGTGTTSPYELVQAYSIFLNKGRQVKPVFIRRIEDQDGKVLYTAGPEIVEEPIISEQTAETISAILCNAVNNGTGSALRTTFGFKNEIGGKTGTTQNHTDGWFVGITPDLITAIWVGGDNPIIHFRNITYGQGAYMALPIYGKYMTSVYNDPITSVLANASFNFSDQTISSLDCDDFREKQFDSIKEYLEKKEESIGDFIKRIFGRNKNKEEKTEEPEDNSNN